MTPPNNRYSVFDDRVNSLFTGREEVLNTIFAHVDSPFAHPLLNVHGVTGTGKSFVLHRTLQLARERGLKTAKVQFDGKDREESVTIGQHSEILRQIALKLETPTPRFATAYLAWSLAKEIGQPGQASALPSEVRELFGNTIGNVLNFVIASSIGPGGLLVSAARAGWRVVAERVSTEPLAAFAKSAEGKAFAESLKSYRPDDIPAQLGAFLAQDLRQHLKPVGPGARAVVAFDSWEQFEERYPERRSRWYEEVQILELFQACREFVQFVAVGQRPVTWLTEDRTLREQADVVFVPLQGLSRTDASSYLSHRRMFTSSGWIEAMLDATSETRSGEETRHHALSLGMIADTAEEILAQNPNALPSELSVKPNDLEDLVRRFLSVREELEPVFERLSLTPRFDDQCIAFALGKPYDEFCALTDFEAMLKYSFIEQISENVLSMHGQMRRTLRERMHRYAPAKIRAAHTAWRRHYDARGMESLAFRHDLGMDADASRLKWMVEIADALRSGDAKGHAALVEFAEELEDELPYIPATPAGELCIAFADGIRQCPIGVKSELLANAVGFADRALKLISEKIQNDLWAMGHMVRGQAYSAWADHMHEATLYEQACESLIHASERLSMAQSSAWAQCQVWLCATYRSWGRSTGRADLIQKCITFGDLAVASIDQAENPEDWAEANVAYALAQTELGHIQWHRQGPEAAIEALTRALTVYREGQHPLKWAEAMLSVGKSYRDLADFEPGTEALEKSHQAYEHAERVYARATLPWQWANLQISRAYTLVEWGHREQNAARFDEAITRCRGCLDILTRETDQLGWSLAWGNIAKALRYWADCDGDTEKYFEAADGFRKAVEGRPRDSVPFYWALAHVNLAETLMQWHQVMPDDAKLKEAKASYTEALEVVSPEAAPYYFDIATVGLAKVVELTTQDDA